MSDNAAFVQVSSRDSRYLELSNGRPYVPIGLNLVPAPPPEKFAGVLDVMAQNRLNYCRVWLNCQGSFLFEGDQSGVFDEGAARNLDRFLALARERGIRVKPCLEYFRNVVAEKKTWSDNTIHHRANGGPFLNRYDFLTSEQGIAQFKRKLAWYRDRVGDDPAVYAWELWNEMNCLGPISLWAPWTRTMLAELQRLFPRHLAVQSLGSFDCTDFRVMYAVLATLQDNDIAQVHRYLDLGARWDICHGPVDLLAAEAVRELKTFGSGKPIILAESGAVEPRHSGPFSLYEKDVDGLLLHDVIWAPFMAGAAGPGHVWHWQQYVERHNLWWQYARFAEAIEGLDPPTESFEPLMIEHPRLRVYVLRGKRSLLAWCRDKENAWCAELRDGKAPETLDALAVDLSSCLPSGNGLCARTYDPWTDAWATVPLGGGKIALPAFRRSIVIRVD